MSIQQAYESYGNKLIGAGGGGSSLSQIQSDWNVSDNARVDYIKNKPDVPSDADDLDYSNTSSELSATKVQGAIDELAKPTFTEAGTRANIASGEKLSTIFGKIKKFFTDLKTVAFTGAYSDLTGKPNLATVATSGSYNDLSNKPSYTKETLVWTNSDTSASFGEKDITGVDLSNCDYVKIIFKINNNPYTSSYEEYTGIDSVYANRTGGSYGGSANSGSLGFEQRTATFTRSANATVHFTACTTVTFGLKGDASGTPTNITVVKNQSTGMEFLIPYQIIKVKR